jgi:hypothetical protein
MFWFMYPWQAARRFLEAPIASCDDHLPVRSSPTSRTPMRYVTSELNNKHTEIRHELLYAGAKH